jgi:hypothetical protein
MAAIHNAIRIAGSAVHDGLSFLDCAGWVGMVALGVSMADTGLERRK